MSSKEFLLPSASCLLPFVSCLLPFVVLATSNSAGYRYGASDLAFYGPAVMRQLDPALFPRDRVLIDAQARLTFMDETVGSIARLTTDRFPALFLGLYLATLALLALGAAAIGAQMYRSSWTVAALLVALTLRHAIQRSGTNTLEAYFHPRQLAFALGAIAVAAFLRGSLPATLLAMCGAALLHPTTTLWFAIWMAVAVFVSEKRWRTPLAVAAVAAVSIAVWALLRGPLAGRLGVMDDEWLTTLADKEYLFPLQWPLHAWAINLAYAVIIGFIYRHRSAAGLLRPREPALVIGCLSLILAFLAAVALGAGRVALAIQLQPARVFWMLDFLAIVYVTWIIAEGAAGSSRRAQAAAVLFLVLSAIRGAYVMRVEFPDRQLFERSVAGDWGQVSTWALAGPRTAGWLAHPNHASMYGTSFRMSAGRDVLVEGVKDAAVGMYDRSIALRTRDRIRAVGNFDDLGPDRARQLAVEYDLEYMVTEQELELPLAFQSGALRVYRLR
jgi:hypothetical protein